LNLVETLTGLPWVEVIGYVGSVLVAISLALSDLSRLRVVNLIGAAVFTVYGLLVAAYPVALLNGFIVAVNIVYLVHMMRDRDFFEILDVTGDPGPFVERFLEHHRAEIAQLAPAFDLARLPEPHVLMILRNLEPAGLVVWTDRGDGVARVDLDFAAPRYRDLGCGRWFSRQSPAWFAERGIRRLEAYTPQASHARYLEAVGFVADTTRERGWYLREISPPTPSEGHAP
jgi:hypothetical protein